MNALLVISAACICAAAGLPQYYPYTAGYAAAAPQPYAAVAPYSQLTYDYSLIPDTAEAPAAPAPYALPPPPVPAHYQSLHHSQDEFGQFAYGHSSLLQAHNAVRDYTGAVQGSYSYIDADGNEVVAKYVADQGGFRVSSNALPVAPVFDGEAPVAPEVKLEAPVFDLEAPVFDLEPAVETPEVAAAREEHFRLVEEHKAILAAALVPETVEEPAEAPVVEVAAEEPALAVEIVEEPVEAPAEAPVEVAAEEPALAVEIVEEPVEAPAEAPAELSVAEESPVEVAQEEAAAPEEQSRRKRQVILGGQVLYPQFYRALPAEPLVLEAGNVVQGAASSALRDADLLRVVHHPSYALAYRVD